MASGERIQLDMRRLEDIAQRVGDGMAGEIAAALAAHVVDQAKAAMGTGKSGQAYRRKNQTHVASAPGEPPAVDTGALRESIHAAPVDERTYRVADGVPYGVHLEFGTRHMRARPFMRPALEDMRKNAVALVRGITDGVFTDD